MEMTTQDLEFLSKMGIAPQETEEERKARYERVRLEMLLTCSQMPVVWEGT